MTDSFSFHRVGGERRETNLGQCFSNLGTFIDIFLGGGLQVFYKNVLNFMFYSCS